MIHKINLNIVMQHFPRSYISNVNPILLFQQVRRRPDVLRHREGWQPRELQGDVARSNQKVLSQHSSYPRRLQKRRSVHLQRRAIPQILPRPKPSSQVSWDFISLIFW